MPSTLGPMGGCGMPGMAGMVGMASPTLSPQLAQPAMPDPNVAMAMAQGQSHGGHGEGHWADMAGMAMCQGMCQAQMGLEGEGTQQLGASEGVGNIWKWGVTWFYHVLPSLRIGSYHPKCQKTAL